MKVITFLNEKGGVGKTTLATTIAAGLAIQGAKVLLIDADAQGNATQALGVKPYGGYYDLLERDAEFADIVRVVAADRIVVPDNAPDLQGKILLIGSNHETRHVMSGEGSETPLRLRERLEVLDGVVDVVLIDTSPSPSMMHSMIYLATDALVFPTQLQAWSLQGLFRSVKNLNNFNPFRRGLGFADVEILGIVPTQTELRTSEHAENHALLVERFGADMVWRPMAKRITWQEAAHASCSIYAFDPNASAIEYANYLIEQVAVYVSA